MVLPLVLVGIIAIVAAQLATPGPGTSMPRSQRADLTEAAAATAETLVRPPTPAPAPSAPAPTTTTTTTAPTAPPSPPAPSVTPPTAPAAPDPVPATPSALPAVGQATAWGCAAALAYLQAYAAKSFTLECPGYAEGHDAMTCLAEQGTCPSSAVIAIADACPAAYMNEASNSWVLSGASDAPIDPYGPCP
jgi:hypothetical protein